MCVFEVLLSFFKVKCKLVDDMVIIVEDFVKFFDGIGGDFCCGCYFFFGYGCKIVVVLCKVVDDFEV